MIKHNNVRDFAATAKGGLFWVLVIWILSNLAGCAIPALLGVKSYTTKESRTEFITGADFSFGLSGTDTLDNKKGIKPTVVQ